MISRNRFGMVYLLGLAFLACSFVIRTVLFLKAGSGIDATPLLVLKVFGTGLFFDVVTLSYFAAPFALYLTVVPDRFFHTRWHQIVLQALVFAALFVLLFDAVAEFLFFDEFGTRFNFIAVDYLVYTREVLGNIRESYSLTGILAGVLAATTTVFLLLRRPLHRAFLPPDGAAPRVLHGAVLFLFLPLLAFAFVDQSTTMLTTNSYAAEVAGNGIYDLFAAFRNSELDFGRFYPTQEERAVLGRLRGLVKEPNNRLVSDELHDITREIRNPGPEKRLNVIVVVEESLSAEYLGVFGNDRGLTPNLDRLAKESLVFTHLYAAGTRTVRGLEAITLSQPPLPGTSIVKRRHNEGLFSWGSVMRDKGYDVKFLYGGHGYFDNMNAFFGANGFDVVDRSDLSGDEVSFANAWGACDEDLFKKVIVEAGASDAAGKPFFSLVMTTSNHRPFTYPEGTIEIPSGSGRGGGVKYADYAVGRFIEAARKQPWFDNTLFVVVADHCAGSAGKSELPVKRYEIPMLIYAPGHVKPGRVDRLASQIDVAPTVLGLLHFSYRTKFLGKDIFKTAPSQARAFISTYQKLGFIKDDSLVVIGPKRYLAAYRFDGETGNVRTVPASQELVDEALAYYQGADLVYKYGLNRND